MILYLNPTSYERGPVARYDPTKFLIEYTGQVGVGGTYIFRFQSLTDSVVVQDQGTQYLLTPTSPVASGTNFSQQLRPGDGLRYSPASWYGGVQTCRPRIRRRGLSLKPLHFDSRLRRVTGQFRKIHEPRRTRSITKALPKGFLRLTVSQTDPRPFGATALFGTA